MCVLVQDATQQPLEAAAEALPTSIHLSMQADTSDSNVESPHADEPFNSVAASDTTLPDCGSAAASDVSTVCEAQTVETAPKVDKAFQPALVSQHESASQTALGSQQDETAQHESVSQAVTEAADEEEDVQESWAGQASVMSDGSFVNVSVDQAEDSLADDTEQLEDIVAVADAVTSSVDIDEGVQEESLQLSDATKEVLDLLETEVGEEHTNESLETTPADGCADQVCTCRTLLQIGCFI